MSPCAVASRRSMRRGGGAPRHQLMTERALMHERVLTKFTAPSRAERARPEWADSEKPSEERGQARERRVSAH